MTAQIIKLNAPKPVRERRHRTIFRITEAMYLQLKELQKAEREGKGLAPWEMSFRVWKSLHRRGLIAAYEIPSDWGRWCLTPPGRFAIELWEADR